MRGLRRRLASCALALLLLQCAMAFAAPISACCAPRASTAAQAAADEGECCPPGSHPPGQCPLHKDKKSTAPQTSSRASQCRMVCDGPHGPQLMLTTVGLLPAPIVTDITLASTAIAARDAATPVSRHAFPDAPPPKRL